MEIKDMKNSINIIGMVLLSLIFNGPILSGAEATVTKDVIVAQNEAISIAQNLMREKGLDKDWNILKPKIKYDNAEQIGIRFFSKHRFALNSKMAMPYLVVISKSDGNVVAFGQDK